MQDTHSKRGLCRARLGQWRPAWLDHDRALNVARTVHQRALHYYNRASCALHLGMLEEAEADYKYVATHGHSVLRSGAAQKLLTLKQPLQEAFEAQKAWLSTYYPTLAQLPTGRSVDAFRNSCLACRRAMAREDSQLTGRVDAFERVHKAALAQVGGFMPFWTSICI